MKIVFNLATRERRAAVIEDDRVVEIMIERPEQDRIVHNVYLGKVVRVLPGMQAAFVDIGREKNGFLYRDHLLSYHLSKEDEDVKRERTISQYVRQGEEVLVQVTKEAFGTKGPRLTEIISFPGQYIVYMPNGKYVGVSKKMKSDAERERLRKLGESLIEGEEGLIIRTACEGKADEVIVEELHYFRVLWQEIINQAKKKKAPSLLYQSSNLVERFVRDFIGRSIEEIVVDTFEDYKRLKDALSPYPALQRVVRFYRDNENVFSAYGIESELEKALRRQVWLKNGAYLVIDETEALTVIDVNTGKFVGKNDVHDTILKTNVLAAKEIARQLRLRDISGIIIIDFIDMERQQDQMLVLEQLKTELKKDRTKTNVVGLTGLGLVEMTRKKVHQNLQASLSKRCPTCLGKGVVLSEEAQAYKIERALFEYRDADIDAIVVELPADVAPVLLDHVKQLEESLGYRIFVYANETLADGDYFIRYVGEEEEAIRQLERLKMQRN